MPRPQLESWFGVEMTIVELDPNESNWEYDNIFQSGPGELGEDEQWPAMAYVLDVALSIAQGMFLHVPDSRNEI